MIDLALIGIGTGNPDHLTRQAEAAMNAADLILLPRKGDARSDLIDLRRTLCARVLARPVRVVEFDLPVRAARGDYLAAVDDWHDAIAATWAAQIARHLPDGGRLALLVWGDPSLYDSTLRIAARLCAGGLPLNVRVIPGITSLQALTAAHAIPLNMLGAPVLITTGRRLRDGGWPGGVDSVAVMLDGDCAFTTLAPAGVTIWWGACLGMAQQALVAGPLAAVASRIVTDRAALRARQGWIMDIYLLAPRRTGMNAPRFDAGFVARLDDLLRWRRDVRHFHTRPVPDADMQALLAAAACAPSVGNAQPWRFVRIRSAPLRARIADHVDAASHAAAHRLADDALRDRYAALKLHGLREAPELLAVFCDDDPAAGHGLGRATMAETLRYSTVTAIYTLWLAAAARGYGLGWVSILDPAAVAAMLDVPRHWSFVALLCIGTPLAPSDTPELERRGWQAREPIADRVFDR